MADGTDHKLRRVDGDRLLGAASKRAYRELYLRAKTIGSAEIVVTAADLGATFGRSPRAALKWLEQLEKHGLVSVVDRDKRRGTIFLYVYKPFPGTPIGSADPQRMLEFGECSPNPTPKPAGGHSDLSARKGPSTCQGSDLSARKGPSSKPPPAKDLATGSDLSARKGPSAFIDTNEKQRSILPMSQGTTRFNDSNEVIERNPRADRLPSDGAVDGATEPVGIAVAEALGRFEDATTPTEQKRRLEARIRGVVADPSMHRYVAGKAADLVIFHHVPLRDLERILGDVEAMRQGGGFRRSAGAFFHAMIQRLAARRGIDWTTFKTQQTRESHAGADAQDEPDD